MPSPRSSGLAGLLLCSAVLLAGCGNDGSVTDPNTTITGTAATGAPLAAATVNLRCKGGSTATATTSATGKWSVTVPTTSLPCAVQVAAGGIELYSLTFGSGGTIVANLTPLTTLAIAGASGDAPDDAWFDSLNDGGLQTLGIDLATALTALANALQTQGFTLPAGTFNPFVITFDAEAGNAWDDLLEALKSALDNASSDLPTLLASYAAGGDLPGAPEGGGGSCSSGDDKLVFTGYPGDFCGFTREASANTIPDYYQFTSTAGTHGTTYVKFTLAPGGGSVQTLVIENDDYAFSCGGTTACNGIIIRTGSTYIWFELDGTLLEPLFGATGNLTVNGMVTHIFPAS